MTQAQRSAIRSDEYQQYRWPGGSDDERQRRQDERARALHKRQVRELKAKMWGAH
jgi:hypothetical protein